MFGLLAVNDNKIDENCSKDQAIDHFGNGMKRIQLGNCVPAGK